MYPSVSRSEISGRSNLALIWQLRPLRSSPNPAPVVQVLFIMSQTRDKHTYSYQTYRQASHPNDGLSVPDGRKRWWYLAGACTIDDNPWYVTVFMRAKVVPFATPSDCAIGYTFYTPGSYPKRVLAHRRRRHRRHRHEITHNLWNLIHFYRSHRCGVRRKKPHAMFKYEWENETEARDLLRSIGPTLTL